ncbi:MAG: nucleotidyltransferase family protein [Candidatus Diapherotrites archaeon]
MRAVRKAFVLAGGIGSRLRPFTLEIPKPLLPVKGKPVLEYNLENLKVHGVKEVVLGVGYKAEKVREYFGNGERLGLKIKYSLEKEPLGTAGALKLAEKHFDSTFYMCNGDEVKDINYSLMLELHREKKAIGTLALVEVEDASEFGRVETRDNLIVSFREKDGLKERGIVSAGAYVLEKKVLRMIPKREKYSIEKQVFPLLAEKKKLFGCKMATQFFPADNPQRYEKAIMEWNGITGGGKK